MQAHATDAMAVRIRPRAVRIRPRAAAETTLSQENRTVIKKKKMKNLVE